MIKIRKSFRSAYILILLLIIAVCLFTLYNTTNSDNKKFVKTNIYEYNNKFSYSYDVNLVENDYITKENISDGNAYITDLLDKVSLDMKYLYNANKKTDITYTYQIIGNLEATYLKDGVEQKVWKKTDVLVPMKENNSTGEALEVNEVLDVNLKEKIQEVKNFQAEVGMQVQTKYTVVMEMVTRTNVLGQEIINIYSPDVVFEIGSKTTTVSTTVENSEKPQVATKMINEQENKSQIENIILTGVVVVAGILLVVALFTTKNSNTVRNEYKLELNKILKSCQEKIVVVKDKIKTEEQNVVDVNDFDEIIKVSEELFKPILYWNNESEEESWFCVDGSNIVYRFILKR